MKRKQIILGLLLSLLMTGCDISISIGNILISNDIQTSTSSIINSSTLPTVSSVPTTQTPSTTKPTSTVAFTIIAQNRTVKDEEIIVHERPARDVNRFEEVEKLEAMTADERFAFWKEQLQKCIRCNACRNVCPACSCIKCVFDNPASGISAKANDSEFEEKLFHIIRAFHVAGRCTDCGECSRVCPQNIPLHLLNRKFIKDIDGLYGEYQAGETDEGKTPLTSYTEGDAEPNDVVNGEAK